MKSPSCFIGVVSYEGSRFAVSQGPDGLAAALARALPPLGIDVDVQVNTENRHDERALPVDDALVQGSLEAQLRLESAWVDYLDAGRRMSPQEAARRTLRWCLRQWRRVRPPDARFVRRLINIELSHVDLLAAGVAAGADWVLVLEDDAESADIDDCAQGLAALITSAPESVRFVNVSESFTLEQLGIAHLVSPSGARWAGSASRDVLSASRPVSNTVCAILYRRAFAEQLLAAFDGLPMTPVVPIDWKLNEALMRMHASGVLTDGSCWQVTPAPILQMSMQPAGAPS